MEEGAHAVAAETKPTKKPRAKKAKGAAESDENKAE